MSQPWGYNDRDKSGLRGLLARWWYRRRSAAIKRAMRRK